MVHPIRKPCEFSVEVPQDEIHLLGSETESAGRMLEGNVRVNVTEPMKVKSITLRFSGKIKASWTEGSGHQLHYYREEQTLIDKKVQCLPVAGTTPRKTYTLSVGEHAFPFQLPLPGDLPQSLEANGGQIRYQLKAVMDRPVFAHNIVVKKPIRLIRCLLPSQTDLVQSLEIHNTWAEKMEYDISLPSKIYAYGEMIPIMFRIRPIASQLCVRTIKAVLKEYCTYHAQENSKTDARYISMEHEESPFTQMEGWWSFRLRLNVPANSPLVFCDADNELIQIRHKLKFVISLTNADGHVSELRCAVAVILVESFAQQPQVNTLPAYDETWRHVTYDPQMHEALRRASLSSPRLPASPREPVTMSGFTGSLGSSPGIRRPSVAASLSQQVQSPQQPHPLSSSITSLAVDDASTLPWWTDVDLSRVPSYHTAVQQEPATVSSSLPSYDQLSLPSPRLKE